MSLLNVSLRYIDDNIKNYYHNEIITFPFGPINSSREDFTMFSLNLMLRYLTGNYKYNIILPIGFLFNRSRGYSKLRISFVSIE